MQVTDWNPGVDGSVLAIVVSGTTVYAGGIANSVAKRRRRAGGAITTMSSGRSRHVAGRRLFEAEIEIEGRLMKELYMSVSDPDGFKEGLNQNLFDSSDAKTKKIAKRALVESVDMGQPQVDVHVHFRRRRLLVLADEKVVPLGESPVWKLFLPTNTETILEDYCDRRKLTELLVSSGVDRGLLDQYPEFFLAISEGGQSFRKVVQSIRLAQCWPPSSTQINQMLRKEEENTLQLLFALFFAGSIVILQLMRKR